MPRARKAKTPDDFKPPPRASVTGTAVGIDVDPDRVRQQPPRLDPCPPFLLCYDPKRWTVLEGHCIPLLGRLSLEPGVEGIKSDRAGRLYWREASGRRQDKGQTVIPHAWGPTELPGGKRTYLRRYAVANGRVCHLEQWATPHAGTDRITTDAKGYADWIQGLFDEGKLDPPELWALEKLRDDYDRQIIVARDVATHVPSMKVHVDRLTKDRRAVQDKLDELAQGSAPVDGAAVAFDDDEG
jgi:hypothetical protein